MSEIQKSMASTIVPGVKRKAVNLERPNIGALFSSDEINFLVYRYLVENGYQHTAYTFGSESHVHNAQIDNNQVPKGALIKILQKGVFFAEAELYSLMDGEAIEKYEKTTGTVSLIESANPPAKKKVCPVIDKRVVERSVNRLKQHRRDLYTRELEIIQKQQQEELARHAGSEKSMPKNSEKDTAHQMANKNTLKNIRDKEHEREKETKDHDKREKAIQAVTSSGHLSNGINSPAHHRAKLENKRMHSATPPSTSAAAIPSSSQTQMPANFTQQHLQMLQQQLLQQHQQQQQLQQQQLAHQPLINSSMSQLPPNQHSIQQHMIQQQQQQQHQPQTNHHSHSSTPSISVKDIPQTTIQQQQQQQQQARGTPQPQQVQAGQSAASIAQQQQQHLTQLLPQSFYPFLNPTALAALNGLNINMNDKAYLQVLAGMNPQQMAGINPQPPSGIGNGIPQQQQQHGAPQSHPKHQLLKLSNPQSSCFLMDLETTENFSLSWNPKLPYLIGVGFSQSNARFWYLPFEIPISKWDAGELKTRWRHLVLPSSNSNNNNNNNHHQTDGEKKTSVPSTDWSADGNLMATASRFGSIRIWGSDGGFFRNLEAHNGPIVGLSFSPSGNRIFTIGVDRKVIVWESVTGKQIQIYFIRKVIDYHWLNDEIFAVSAEVGILALHVGEAKPIREIPIASGSDINTIRFDRYETGCLAAGYEDAKVCIWDLKKPDPLLTFRAHSREVHTLRWHPKGQIICSVDYGNRIIVWGAFTAEIILNYTHSETLNNISFSPNGKFIAATAYDGRILAWNIESKNLIFNMAYKFQFYELSWNSSGEWLAASATGCIAVADLRAAIKDQEQKI